MNFEIKNRYNGSMIFRCEAKSWRLAIELAVKSYADLSSANLSSANLSSADLSSANLRSANLRSADLSSADLSSANLSSADLSSANLRDANLRDANLRDANLRDADLRYADLSSADLSSANLRYANLRSANLSSANLSSADLSYANNFQLAIARTRILPAGDLIGWKKCRGGTLVKLLIPKRAKRSHAFGRKCRAEYVKVLTVYRAKCGISTYDPMVRYNKNKYVRCRKWDDDWTAECSGGIHFYITREEAEDH